jgi:hypothetical protein
MAKSTVDAAAATAVFKVEALVYCVVKVSGFYRKGRVSGTYDILDCVYWDLLGLQMIN